MKVGFDTKGFARKVEKIPSLYKAIIVFVLALVLLAGFIYFLAKPQWEAREELEKEYAKLNTELNNLKQISSNLERHKKEYAQMQMQLDDILKQLPETKDIPNLLRNITNVSEETRLRLNFFEPKEIKQRDFYSEVPFEIKFSGPFHSVATFFDDVRRLDRLVNISNYSLVSKGSGKNAVLEGSCSANAYVYLKTTAQKKDNKAGKEGGK